MAVIVKSNLVDSNLAQRTTLRNSKGVPYVVGAQSNTADVVVMKGDSESPTSFTEQDTANNPSTGIYRYASAAIDSNNIIHIVYSEDNGKTSACRYVTFNTNTDTYAGDVAVDSDIGSDPNSALLLHTAISVDSNDIPHIVYTRYDPAMGADYFTATYNNRVGGAWNALGIEVDGANNTIDARYYAIEINQSSIPVIAYLDGTNNQSKRAIGNANDASLFTLATLDTSLTASDDIQGLAIDTNNNPIVSNVDSDGTLQIYIDTTQRNLGVSGIDPNVCAVGTDIYLIWADISGSPKTISYDIWDGTSWAGATVLQSDGNNKTNPKWKFSLNNNFGSDGNAYSNSSNQLELDYTWESLSGVYWDTLSLKPTVALNTADLTEFATDEPTLEFTGTDADGARDIRYNIEIDTVNTFDSTEAVCDSYPTSNYSGSFLEVGDTISRVGQSFTGDGKRLFSCEFYLHKSGTPTGNVTARLYAHSGTYGTSSVPTGSPIAISETKLDISTLTGTAQLIEFFFARDDITLVNGTKYCIEVHYQGVAANLRVSDDNSSPTHGGNSYYYNTGYIADSGRDVIFYLNTVSHLSKVSGTDAGFANVDTPADTDPFNDGDKVDYDVQTADALADDTYYWRVRGQFPDNVYGEWSAVRSFDVVTGAAPTLLVVADSSHEHIVDNTVLTHHYELGNNDSNHAHSAENVILSSAYSLTVAESTHGHTSDEPILTHDYSLVPDESLHAQTAENVVLASAYDLTLDDSLHSHLVENIDLDASVTLVSNESSHSHEASEPILVHVYALIPNESLHGHSADNVVLSSHYDLVSSNSKHAHVADEPILDSDYNLVSDESLHSHNAESPTLDHTYDLSSNESLHGHTADNVNLDSGVILIVSDCDHSHSVESTILSSSYTLVSQQSNHAHSADEPLLTHDYDLVTSESLHGHTVDNTVLGFGLSLIISSSKHAHTADAPLLGSGYDLVPSDSVHSHTSENVVLGLSTDLVAQDSAHSHAADTVILSTAYVLSPNGSEHAHKVSEPILITLYTLSSDETLHSHSVDGVTLDFSTTLIVEGSVHSHSAQNTNLVQDYVLSVNGSLHDHLVDNVVLYFGTTLVVASSAHSHAADIVFISPDFVESKNSNNIAVIYIDSRGYLRVYDWMTEQRVRYYQMPASIRIRSGIIIKIEDKLAFINSLKNQETLGIPSPLTINNQHGEPANRPRELKSKKSNDPFKGLSAYKKRKMRKMYSAGDHDNLVLYMDKNGLTGGCSTCNKKTKSIRLIEHGIRNKLL